MEAIVLQASATMNRPRMVIRITAIEGLTARTLLAAGRVIPIAENERTFIEGRLTLFQVPAPT